MGIEKKLYDAPLGYRIKKGLFGLGVGAIAIYAGITSFGKMLPDNQYQYQREYKTKNPQNITLIKQGEKIENLIVESIPVILIGLGAAAGVSGLTYLTNRTYRRK
jgi:hypothetical protein